jgi:hypothetical protein
LREGLVINQESKSAQLLQWDIGGYVRQLSDNVKEQSVRNGEWICKAPIATKISPYQMVKR